MAAKTYRKFLADEFEKRVRKNKKYSLRAYARDLGISRTHITQILRGKNKLSSDLAAKFVEKLNLDSIETEIFIDLVEMESDANKPAKLRAQRRMKARNWVLNDLESDEFAAISEWYYLPLIELLTTDLENYSADYLAKRLGLPIATMQEALAVLLQHKFITQKGEKLVALGNNATPAIPSATIRNYYRQNLSVAATALEKQSIDQRDFSVATMALNKKQLNVAKERIKQFQRELALELGESVEKDAVYNLSVCFFEATL